jgi:hypothetical protein
VVAYALAQPKDGYRRVTWQMIDAVIAYQSESNGLVEQFHRSTRDALEEQALTNLSQARAITGTWVRHYNDERLHAGLEYLPPAEFYRGNPAARIAERQAKLERARQKRQRINTRLTRAA